VTVGGSDHREWIDAVDRAHFASPVASTLFVQPSLTDGLASLVDYADHELLALEIASKIPRGAPGMLAGGSFIGEGHSFSVKDAYSTDNVKVVAGHFAACKYASVQNWKRSACRPKEPPNRALGVSDRRHRPMATPRGQLHQGT
jgi:hypothetical protein